MRRAVAVVCCFQCACVSWRPVSNVSELIGGQVVRVDDEHAHVVMRNARGCPDEASITGNVIGDGARSLLVEPQCECSAPPCAGVLMSREVKVRVREHDEDKTIGFVIGMVFAGAAVAALTVVGVLFLAALTHSGGY